MMVDVAKLYTVAEVAEILKIHRQTVLKMIHKGDILAINANPSGSGRHVFRISGDELDEYIKRVGIYESEI